MKPSLNARLSLPLLLCLAFGLTAGSHAQEEERWFRVELLVFTHETGNPGESFQPLPQLSYPVHGRFLWAPGQYEPSQAPSADQPIEDPNEPLPQPTTAQAARPTAFVTLPQSQREFAGKAAYMQRTGRHRTLFHQSWVQPVSGKAQAIPLILDDSGDTGRWPSLQGSIQLHLARYLHLETNLWLNTNGHYLPGDWRMPAPPFGPSRHPPEESLEYPPAGEPPAHSIPGEPVIASSDADSANLDSAVSTPDAPLAVYPWRHAVLLQQKRRMRSNEVHYLDHPLFGIVIKLVPLSEEELEIMAQAENT